MSSLGRGGVSRVDNPGINSPDAHTYVRPKYIGLIFPTKLFGHKFTRRQAKLATKAYLSGISPKTKQLNLSIQFEASTTRQEIPYLIGLFQNPEMRARDIRQAWVFHGGLLNLEELFETGIPWNEQVLEVMLGNLEVLTNGAPRYSVVSAFSAVGRYSQWNAKNCHILASANEPISISAFKNNRNVEENVKVMFSLMVGTSGVSYS